MRLGLKNKQVETFLSSLAHTVPHFPNACHALSNAEFHNHESKFIKKLFCLPHLHFEMKITFIALSNQYLNITETTMKILIYKIKLPKPQLGQDIGTQRHIPEKRTLTSLVSLSITVLFLTLTAKISTKAVFYFLFFLSSTFRGVHFVSIRLSSPSPPLYFFTTFSIYFLELGKMLTYLYNHRLQYSNCQTLVYLFQSVNQPKN